MSEGRSIISLVAERQDLEQFRKKNWEGSFEEYLDLVRERSAGDPQRLRARLRHDHVVRHRDRTRSIAKSTSATASSAIPTTTAATPCSAWTTRLALLVNAFKSAAKGYGIEKRVLLLHGPVGSSKSTIARLLKKGLERYSRPRRRRAVHARLGRPGGCRTSCIGARCTRSRCT